MCMATTVVVAVIVLKWYFGALLRCLGKMTRCNATWPDQELLHCRANQTGVPATAVCSR